MICDAGPRNPFSRLSTDCDDRFLLFAVGFLRPVPLVVLVVVGPKTCTGSLANSSKPDFPHRVMRFSDSDTGFEKNVSFLGFLLSSSLL